jgi:hypothetical protein
MNFPVTQKFISPSCIGMLIKIESMSAAHIMNIPPVMMAVK